MVCGVGSFTKQEECVNSLFEVCIIRYAARLIRKRNVHTVALILGTHAFLRRVNLQTSTSVCDSKQRSYTFARDSRASHIATFLRNERITIKIHLIGYICMYNWVKVRISI